MAPRRIPDGDDGDGLGRLCVATRTVRPVEALIRFVAGPDGALVPDLRNRLPGRGVWVGAQRALVEEAMRRKAFARSLKQPVTVSPRLAEEVEALLEKAAREAVSLANKAGAVVSGFSKVEAAIGQEKLAGVLEAADAAPDGVRKIAQALRRRFGHAAEAVPVVAVLDSTQLGLALGRSHVIHAALLDGPVGRAALARLRALERYRDPTPPPAAGAGDDHADDLATGTTTRVPAGQGRND
ncbi:RNA-binding protein [Alsobacter sp. R-9]